MNQELLTNFPPKNEKELFDTLQFIKKSPLAKDYWPILKSLYKKCETALVQEEFPHLTENLLLMIVRLIIRIDQASLSEFSSPYPTQATLRYMKRRARRFLRTIGNKSPEMYFSLASKILLAHEDKSKLDFTCNWIAADIILGKSRRCLQKGHGQGKYVFEHQRFHLHQREDFFPEVWDQNPNFLNKLLELNLPWEVYEFVIKIFYANQWQISTLSEERLRAFFVSPSTWLKRTAAQVAYRTYTFQGLKPEIFAGMWLFSPQDQRVHIERIQSKRPSLSKNWYQDYSQTLFALTFKELQEGNNSRRIIKVLELLQKKYPKAISTQNILSIAPALFASSSKTLQELAFLGVEQSKKEDALAWILALDPGIPDTKLNMKLYDRLALTLLPKFKNDKISRDTIASFVFKASFAACDFGWRLSKQIRYEYEMYYIWNRISQFNQRRSMKEIYWKNAITSMAGADAFTQYFKQYGYYFSYMSDEALRLIWEVGLDRVRNFTFKTFRENFIKEPFYYLYKISVFPDSLKNNILEDALKQLKGKALFQNYWYLSTAFQAANSNDWAAQALLQLIGISKLNQLSVQNIFSQLWHYENIEEAYLQYFNNSPESIRKLVVAVLSEDSNTFIEKSNKIPDLLLEDALASASLATLLHITQLATEESWGKLSRAIYVHLLKKEREVGFWKLILEKIIAAPDQILSSRLIQDARFFELFQNQKDPSILDISDPDMENILLAWSQKNPDLFPMESPELFKLCLHKLPQLRNHGLLLAREKGITLIFGLQLLESGLPDAMEESKHFFESLKPHSQKELDAALALCDSPNQTTREFGLDYLGKRRDNFKDNAQILEFLSEHSDVRVQSFVAEEINQLQLEKPFVRRFDKEILRMKNRSREAKEKIKLRVETTLEIDAATLLEIARSQVKKDAEWAIEQLTKKVLSGEEIEGFVLD